MKTWPPLFSEGPLASRIARVVLYLGWMIGTLFVTLGIGHALRRTSVIVALICLLACFLEYWRVHKTDDGKIEPLDLRERPQ